VSELRNIVADTIADRAGSFGDVVKNVRTDRPFVAEIQAVADMELNETLGRDARESVTFHILDRLAASEIVLGDELTAIGSRFRILRRSDNPVSAQVEFGAMKITEKDK
jgi:hypothetical protein